MMNIEKIEIKPGQYVWIDKKADIKEGDYDYSVNYKTLTKVDKDRLKMHQLSAHKGLYHKVIASSPSLNLEGIPDYVEYLAEHYAKSAEDVDIPYCNGLYYGFSKGYQTAEQEIKNDSWLSPIDTERKWQEEKLVEIFYHYPNASPAWQYMNGLIHIALESKNKFTEEDLKKAFHCGRLYQGREGDTTLEQIIEQIKLEREI